MIARLCLYSISDTAATCVLSLRVLTTCSTHHIVRKAPHGETFSSASARKKTAGKSPGRRPPRSNQCQHNAHQICAASSEPDFCHPFRQHGHGEAFAISGRDGLFLMA